MHFPWQQKNGAEHISVGDGLFTATVVYDNMLPRGTTKYYRFSINGGKRSDPVATQDEAKKQCEVELERRIMRALRQLRIAVPPERES